MARKSSFLQGFEVGTDLYNKGFERSQRMAEMKQRAKDRQYQIGRDKKEDERADKLLQLREDAAKLAKENQDAELLERKRQREEKAKQAQIKIDDWNLVNGARILIDNADWSNIEETTNLASKTLPALSARIKTKEIREFFDLWKGEKRHSAVMDALDTQRDIKTAEDLALSESRAGFIKEKHSLGLGHIKDNDLVRPIIGKMKLLQTKLGSIDPNTGSPRITIDGPEIEQFTSEFAEMGGDVSSLTRYFAEATKEMDMDAYKTIQTQELKDKLERQKAFNDWKENKGIKGLVYGDPASMKIYRTSVQRENLTSEIDWDNVSGDVVAMLATLPEEPNGGYSDETVAKFKAELGRMEGGEIRRRMPKDDASAKSLLFSEIMLFNQNIMEQIEMQGGLPGTAKLIDSYLKDGKLGKLGNYAIDAKTQQYINAADNFIAAVLRKESGAAITEQERKDYWPQYIPVPGDKPEVIRQKLAARQNYMEGTRGASGLLWEDTAETRVAPPPVPFNSKQDLIDAFESGQLSVGDKYAYYDSSNNVIIGDVKGEEEPESEPAQPAPTQPAQDQPDPTPNQMAPTGTPEGQPAPRQLPEVEGDAARGQTDMQVYQTPQPDEELERASSETGQPVGIEPEMPMVIGDEFRTSGEITEDQLQESEVMREFQDLASNGGGENPYAFRRHRVKIGNTTGEIVRTNSRGVFIKIPNGPTRFMSWGALSRRIESGDFKPNKARLNQQLKGE